jgi:hypothetical protein
MTQMVPPFVGEFAHLSIAVRKLSILNPSGNLTYYEIDKWSIFRFADA